MQCDVTVSISAKKATEKLCMKELLENCQQNASSSDLLNFSAEVASVAADGQSGVSGTFGAAISQSSVGGVSETASATFPQTARTAGGQRANGTGARHGRPSKRRPGSQHSSTINPTNLATKWPPMGQIQTDACLVGGPIRSWPGQASSSSDQLNVFRLHFAPRQICRLFPV